MNNEEYMYHLSIMLEQDPDVVCCDLELTTEELIEAFPQRVREFIKENFG